MLSEHKWMVLPFWQLNDYLRKKTRQVKIEFREKDLSNGKDMVKHFFSMWLGFLWSITPMIAFAGMLEVWKFLWLCL